MDSNTLGEHLGGTNRQEVAAVRQEHDLGDSEDTGYQILLNGPNSKKQKHK